MKSRKEIRDSYKQKETQGGVFQIRNLVNNKCFIASSTDLETVWNRHKFQLKAGLHTNTGLQIEWNEFGEASFAFEILQVLPAQEGMNYQKEVRLLESRLIEEFAPFGPKGYHPPRPQSQMQQGTDHLSSIVARSEKNELTSCLLKQFDISWQLLCYHLEGVTTEECLWQPAEKGIYVHADGETGWRADWPESEGYETGPPNIAWLSWHIDYWWSMVMNHAFGDASMTKEQVHWKGSADGLRTRFKHLREEWVGRVSGLSVNDCRASHYSRWPLAGCPFGDIVAWVNVELMKNAAEIGYIRFLYARREHAEAG